MILTLKNFRKWTDKTLSLPDKGICLISGRSGVGKSTILNALVFVITGKGKNIITYQKKTMSVSLTLNENIEEDKIKITRSRGPNRLIVEKNGVNYEDSEAQSHIDSIFGEEFCNTSYIDQDNTNSFVYLSPSEKMEFLETLILRHFQIDEIKERVKEETAKTKQEHLSMDSKYNTLLDVCKGMKRRDRPSLTIDEKVQVTSFAIAEKLLEKIRNNVTVVEKNAKTVSLKIKKTETEITGMMKAAEKRQQIQAILDDTNSQLSSFDTKEYYLSEIERLTREKDECVFNREYLKWFELSKKIEEAEEKNKEEKRKALIEIEKIPSLKLTKDCIRQLEKADGIISQLLTLEESISKDESNIEDIEQIEARLEEETKLFGKYQTELTYYRCPSCDKTLKICKEKLEVVSSSLDKKNREELQTKIQELKKSMVDLRAEIDQKKRQKTIYEKNEEEYNRIFDVLDSLMVLPTGETIQQEDISNKLEEMKGYLSIHEKVGKTISLIDNDRLLVEWKKEINTISPTIRERGEKVEKEIHKVENEEKYQLVVSELSTMKEKMERVRSLTAKLNAYTKEMTLYISNNSDDSNEDKMDQLEKEREKLDGYQKKLDGYRTSITKLEEWIKIDEENQAYEKMENEIMKVKDRLDYLLSRLKGLTKLKDHIKESERKSLVEFVDSLNGHAFEFIESFFEDQDIIVQLKTMMEGKTANTKEKIALNFEVQYNMMQGDLSFLSGGERDRVNLAFTLALAEMVSTKILMLDEVISSLDSQTTNTVLETISEKYKGKLVLVVLHQSNTGFFDHIIEL